MSDGESLRGLVIEAWEKAGCPRWTVAETIEVTERIDDLLEKNDKGRALKFRTARLAGDREYVKSQVRGNRYEWLRPGFGADPSRTDALPADETVERQLAQTLNNAQREAALKAAQPSQNRDPRALRGRPGPRVPHPAVHPPAAPAGRAPAARAAAPPIRQATRRLRRVQGSVRAKSRERISTGRGRELTQEDNTVLLHPECHREVHRRLGASAEPD